MKRNFPVVGLVTVISLLLSVIWPNLAVSATAPTFASLGQLRASGMDSPAAMDVDDSGNLYVADSRGGEVFKFDRYNRHIATFALSASGRGVAVTSDGAKLFVSQQTEVIVADPVTGVQIGVLNGAEPEGQNEFEQANDIELDADGNIYVFDSNAAQMAVKVYDPSYAYQGRFGGPGLGVGQFEQFGGMAINAAGEVVVADSGALNAQIQFFTVDPVSLIPNSPIADNTRSFLTNDTAVFGTPTLYAPKGLTFDDQGRGYFLEFIQSSLRVTDPVMTANVSGFLSKYAQPGSGQGQLEVVADVVFAADTSRLYVSCDTSKVEVFGIDGGTNPTRSNTPPTTPTPQGPIGGSEVSTATPTLVLANSTDGENDPITYDVVVKQGETIVFQTNVAAQFGATTSVAVTSALQENGAFTWTAKAIDLEGAESAVSAAAAFVVNAVEESPTAPVATAPLAGETLDGSGLLQWAASNDPDPGDVPTYRVQIAQDSSFTQVVFAEDVATVDVALGDLVNYYDLVDGEVYYWRVQALDPVAAASLPSDPGSFLYDTTLLTVSSNMPGTSIYFGGNHAYAGRKVGEAPVELRDLSAGSIALVAQRPGFEPYVAQVDLANLQNAALHVELIPAMVTDGLRVRNNGINGRKGLVFAGAAVPFLVDFDNDELLDLLVGDASGQVHLLAAMQLTGRDRIYFEPGVTLALPVLPGAAPFVADWNNDGMKDLLVGLSDGTVKLFLNQGTDAAPAFGGGQDLAAGGSSLDVGDAASPIVVDLNGDGNKDLVVASASGEVAVALNVGTDDAPQLSAPAALLQAGAPAQVAPVDWDADGQVDLVVTVNGAASVYPNNGGVFDLPSVPVAAGDYAAVFAIDLDGGAGKEVVAGRLDGKLELLSAKSEVHVASFQAALLEKVDELAGAVADELPGLLPDVNAIRAKVEGGDLAGAGTDADTLAAQLSAGGAAQQIALELSALVQ